MNHLEHPEKFVAALAAIGAIVGIGRLMAEGDPLTLKQVMGRAILSAGIGAASGTVLLVVPDAHPVLLYGAAAGLASVGTSTLEFILKNRLGGRGGSSSSYPRSYEDYEGFHRTSERATQPDGEGANRSDTVRRGDFG